MTEEKAFSNKIDQIELEELMYDEFYELIAEAKNIGYKKAMRWRDPRVENPQNGQLLLTKMSEDINSVDICRYKNGRYYFYMQNQSSYFTDKPIFREDLTDAITGWRPIE